MLLANDNDETVTKLTLEMLDRWQTNELMNGGIAEADFNI